MKWLLKWLLSLKIEWYYFVGFFFLECVIWLFTDYSIILFLFFSGKRAEGKVYANWIFWVSNIIILLLNLDLSKQLKQNWDIYDTVNHKSKLFL